MNVWSGFQICSGQERFLPEPMNKWKIISIAFSFLVLFGTIGFLVSRFPSQEVGKQEPIQSRYDYLESFSKGEKVFYYNSKGIFQFDRKTNESTQLIAAPVTSYGYPVLSPDNKKAAFYVGNGDHNRWNLLVYDFENGGTKKVIEKVNLLTDYRQSPVWSKDSQFLFVTNRDNYNVNKLYRVDLNGKKTALSSPSSVFYPQVIDENFVAFNVALPNYFSADLQGHSYDEGVVGLVNMADGHLSFFDTPTTTYFAKIKKLNDTTLLKINQSNLSSKGALEKRIVYGLEKLSLSDSSLEAYSIPSNVKMTASSKRVEPLGYCGGRVLLGRVDSKLVSSGKHSYKDEEYKNRYIFNPDDETLQQLAVPEEKFPRCDPNPRSHNIFTIDQTHLTVDVIDVENPTVIKETIEYFGLFPENIQEKITKGCVYSSFAFGTFYDTDFVYIQLYQDTSRKISDCSLGENNVPFHSIYRISKKENSFFGFEGSDDSGTDMPTGNSIIVPNYGAVTEE